MPDETPMNFRFPYLCGLLIALCLFIGGNNAIASNNLQAADTPNELTVFRSPTCGCCEDWLDYIKAEGFQIKDDNVTENMDAIKQAHGVSAGLDSCHTALIDGYVIEGHVPASDVRQLLTSRPNVIGITAPGMPMGSPGMEMGDRADSYTVYAFTAQNKVIPFANHPH